MAAAEETPSGPWFDGSVALAVETANMKGSILMVCLIQEDSDGVAFERRFLEPNVASSLSELNLVSLRLVKDSPDGIMFGQIFPVIIVPSLYLIRNGMLTDFMNSNVDIDQMVTRIERATNGHSQIPIPPNTAIQSAAPASGVTTDSPSSNDSTLTPSSTLAALQPEPQVVAESPSTTESPVASSSVDPDTQSSTTTSPLDQAQVLKDLMKERKLKREKEEREAEKQREINRRASSKALSDAQKELKDKQAKDQRVQIEKDRQEEAEYKRKVKQALEEDKARRKAEKEKSKAAAAALHSLTEEVLTPGDIRAQNAGLMQARNDAGPALAYDSSRLNIRLFDGSSIRNTFKATDTLEDVRKWIDENQQCDYAYNIVQLIPSRTFADESLMLRDLELCPSATLVLKKTATASSAYGGSGKETNQGLMQYGWSALSFAGKMASSAYTTVAYYNPLASSEASGSDNNTRPHATDRASGSASSKKTDREVSYNGNSTNLE